MNETEIRLLGEISGKLDLVIELQRKTNGRVTELEGWRARHEAFHAVGRGEGNVRRRIWDFAWRLVGPVVGALTGYLLARAPRLAQAVLIIKGVMRE